MSTSIYSDLNSFTPYEKSLLLDLESIYQSVDNVLNTSKGERLFNLNFGADKDDQLFEMNDEDQVLASVFDIKDSVGEADPRVEVDVELSTVIQEIDDHRLTQDIVFSVKGMEDKKFSITKG